MIKALKRQCFSPESKVSDQQLKTTIKEITAMKPMNFPERKRQRQLTALSNLDTFTKAGKSNMITIKKLMNRTVTSLINKTTKKRRN